MHVLSVAGIHDGYGIAINDIGKVPLVGVGHVVTVPSADSRLASQKGSFYLIYGIERVVNILFHQLLSIGMPVFTRDILIKRVDFSRAPLSNQIFHCLSYSLLTVSSTIALTSSTSIVSSSSSCICRNRESISSWTQERMSAVVFSSGYTSRIAASSMFMLTVHIFRSFRFYVSCLTSLRASPFYACGVSMLFKVSRFHVSRFLSFHACGVSMLLSRAVARLYNVAPWYGCILIHCEQ